MFGRRNRGDGHRDESTGGRSPTLRHERVERPYQPPHEADPRNREAIEAHFEQYLGPSANVFHEIVSDLVHVDVLHWPATPDRPHHTFATVGMSDLPMTLPDEALEQGIATHAELMLRLPADWPIPHGAEIAPWDDEAAYFPIRWLKILARLPHEYRTWLGFGHTIPNGDPPAPFAANTELCGWVLLPPVEMPAAFRRLSLPDGAALDVFGLIALHRDEMDHKLAHGVESLFGPFDRHGVGDLLDVGRRSVLSP